MSYATPTGTIDDCPGDWTGLPVGFGEEFGCFLQPVVARLKPAKMAMARVADECSIFAIAYVYLFRELRLNFKA